MKYRMNIAGLDRDLPLCKVSDDLYIGAFVMFGDAEITVACARELLARAPKDYDYLLTAEAKSIPLIHEMARQSGAKEYFVARKGLKVYMPRPLHVTVRSITTQHDQDLYLSGEEADKIRGKRVLIVDDVISTGESRWKSWLKRQAAQSQAAWLFSRKAMRRSARTSSTSTSFPSSMQTAQSRNKIHI